jgi:hypothetical protein
MNARLSPESGLRDHRLDQPAHAAGTEGTNGTKAYSCIKANATGEPQCLPAGQLIICFESVVRFSALVHVIVLVLALGPPPSLPYARQLGPCDFRACPYAVSPVIPLLAPRAAEATASRSYRIRAGALDRLGVSVAVVQPTASLDAPGSNAASARPYHARVRTGPTSSSSVRGPPSHRLVLES